MRGGDIGLFGLPQAGRVGPAGPAAPQPATVDHPGRAFLPVVSFLPGPGDRLALLWQEKREIAAFSVAAPLHAQIVPPEGPIGRGQVLDRAHVLEATVASGARTVVVWDHHGRWRAASAGADGRFRRLAAPRGRIQSEHTASTNRDLAVTGRHAALAWATPMGATVVSVRRLGNPVPR